MPIAPTPAATAAGGRWHGRSPAQGRPGDAGRSGRTRRRAISLSAPVGARRTTPAGWAPMAARMAVQSGRRGRVLAAIQCIGVAPVSPQTGLMRQVFLQVIVVARVNRYGASGYVPLGPTGCAVTGEELRATECARLVSSFGPVCRPSLLSYQPSVVHSSRRRASIVRHLVCQRAEFVVLFALCSVGCQSSSRRLD
jgi:hypothetical protein